MRILLFIAAGIIATCTLVSLGNWLVFTILKEPVSTREKWDLTLCCKGKENAVINADITYRKDIDNFILIKDIYNLPFQNNSFQHVLCPYTLQKVKFPVKLYKELNRVGQNVLYVVPPICEIPDSINILQNKHIFITLKREHTELPSFISIPFIPLLHKILGHKFS